MASFKDWTQTKLKETFGLVKAATCPQLDAWMEAADKPLPLTEREIEELTRIYKRLAENGDIWNEEELKMYFIAQLLDLVSFEGENYKLFYERKLTAERNGIKLSGDVDAMIASGNYDEPHKPYFCLHEYKQEKGKREADPRGQLLSEMLAAQEANGSEDIIYGCYMIGRLWFFATLIDNSFCFSGGYAADNKKGIEAIFAILRQLKTYIEVKVS